MAGKTSPSTRFLPGYTFYERHEGPVLRASPERIIDAVASLDMRADPVIDRLLRVREWPRRLATRMRGTTHDSFGFGTFTLLHRDECELSLGLLGRFWRPDLGLLAVADVEEFLTSGPSDAARLVLRFRVEVPAKGDARLVTETFVHCPSWSVKAMMTPYWFAIRASSGWIRRRTLAMIAKALAAQQ
ncbi:hypothetical protein [Paraburkholderia sp. J76]|uniref:hypothetical protein n=1 Tax=Paraburkholderia sp. J76 TaxID=2805439 RepID=UPI002ABDE77A|nr:hypothetical protein [Paraburkholderia sp. J76]